MGKRRVFLYGSSLFMAGVKASLQLCPELDITTVEQSSPHTGEPIVEGRPDAVLFDLTDGQPEFVLDLVKQYPAVALIGVDFTQYQAVVLTGREHQVFSMQDLVQAMDVMSGFSPPPDGWQARCERLWQPFSNWVARLGGRTIGKKTTNDSQHILSKQTPFIAREEPEMKTLSQRNKILLVIAGVLVIAVIAVVVFTQLGGGDLLGATTTLTIRPSNPTIVVGQQLGLVANGAPTGATCTWTTSAPDIVLVGHTAVPATTVLGGAVGQATITVTCGKAGSSTTYVGSTMVKVNPAPPPTPTALPAWIEPANAKVAPLSYTYFNVKNKPGTCTWSSTPSLGQFRGASYCGKDVSDDGVCLYAGLFQELSVTGTVTAICAGRTFTTNLTVEISF